MFNNNYSRYFKIIVINNIIIYALTMIVKLSFGARHRYCSFTIISIGIVLN